MFVQVQTHVSLLSCPWTKHHYHTQRLHLPRHPVNSCCVRGHHKRDAFFVYKRDFLHPSRLALGPNQPPVQWALGLFPGVKRPKRGVDNTPHLVFFLSFYLLTDWQLCTWNCCKPFFSLLFNCQLLCSWRLALIIVVEVFLQHFSGYCSFKNVYYKLVMPNCMPYPLVASVFFLIFKSNLSSFALWKTSSFVILSVHFVFNILLQLHGLKPLGTVRPPYRTDVSLLTRERFLYI